MKNIKYTVTHPIFVFMKKHFCPHCKAGAKKACCIIKRSMPYSAC